MKNKLAKLSAISLLCLPGLIACGGNGEGEQSSTSPTTVVDCTGKGGEVIVDFWHALKNTNYEAIAELTKKFNLANEGKDGICVKLTAKGDYTTIVSGIEAGIKSDGADGFPDIATTYPDHVANYSAGNVLVPLSGYIRDPIKGMPSHATDPKNSYEDILASYRKESENYRFTTNLLDMTKAGETYSLPLNKSTEVMYYNKTFFDIWLGKEAKMKDGSAVMLDGVSITPLSAADLKIKMPSTAAVHTSLRGKEGTPGELGLKDPSLVNPKDITTWWTFDDIEIIGDIIQQITLEKIDFTDPSYKKYSEIELAYADPKKPDGINKNGNWVMSWDSPANLFVTLANQANSYFTLKDAGGKVLPELTFNSPAALANFERYESLYNKGIVTIPKAIGNGTNKYATPAFTTKYLFMSAGSVAGAALNAATDFEMASIPAPVMDKNNPKVIQQGTNVTMLSLPGYDTTALAERKKDAAWEYTKYITSHEGNLAFATKTTYLPTRQSVLDNPEYQEFLNVAKTHPNYAEREAIKTSNGIAEANVFFTDSPFIGSGTIRGDKIDNALLKALTSSEITMAQSINEFFAEIKNTVGNAVCTPAGGTVCVPYTAGARSRKK